MPFPLIPLAIGLAANLPKIISGFSQTSKANKALKALGEQKYPEFTDSPEMRNAYNRAEAMSKYGYSPEERAKFEQDLARNQAGAYQSAVDMSGGNMSQAIGGVLQANQTDAINKFAAGGADLKRQNIQYADSLAQRLQSQRNLQTQNLIARRQMLESAYGQAKSSGLSNVTSGFASIGAIGAQALTGAKTGVGSDGSQTNPDGTFAGQKYDANGNPTSEYLDSAEIAPENVPSAEQLAMNEARYNQYQTNYGLK